MRKALLIATLAACLTASAAVCDDEAIQGIGGAIEPMKEHPSIVMDRMEVDINIWPEYADVDCRFVFRNTGPAATVRMGFPEESFYPPSRDHLVGFTRFATWVDGKPVQAAIEGLRWDKDRIHWKRWRVKQVEFAAGQTRRVRVQYAAPLGKIASSPGGDFQYDLGSGASWKGPIGLAHVTVHGHYRPDRGWLSVFPDFRRVGPTAFEWVARRLNPTEDVQVMYFPGYGGVFVEGEADWEITHPYPHIADGVVWAQAETVAKWLQAEFRATANEAALTKGTRTVSMRRDSLWLDLNGHRIRLPHAPRAEGDRLMVPLAPVARALGATVKFDSKTRETRVELPWLASLPIPSSGFARGYAFRVLPLGFAPPDMADFDSGIVEYYRKHGKGAPWFCAGDFNGDGKRDIALVLAKADQVGVGLLRWQERSTFAFEWLTEPTAMRLEPSGKLFTVVHTRPPGSISYWTDTDRRGPAGRLALKHDGIEVYFWEKAAETYYWDEKAKRYQKVTTAD